MLNGLNVFCDVDFEVIRVVGWGEGSTLRGRAWRSEKAGACWGIDKGSRAKLWCFALVGAGLSLASAGVPQGSAAPRTPEGGPLLAPAARAVARPASPHRRAPHRRAEWSRGARPGGRGISSRSFACRCAGGRRDAQEGGARHARPAAPRRGLQPAAPAKRPAAAPLRRKKRRRRTRRRPLGELRDLAASAGPMADSSPALSLREGGPRAPRPSAPSPPPRSRSGSESEEAELSLSLARTKTRSYGSTASVRAPLGAGVIERHVEHRVRAGDTLQGIALKYGVTVSRVRRGGGAEAGRGLGAGARGRGLGGRAGCPGVARAALRPLAFAHRALRAAAAVTEDGSAATWAGRPSSLPR